MEKKEFLPGTIISEEGQPVQSLMLILEGTVKGVWPGGEMLLKKGDVAGLSEVYLNFRLMTYTAADKVTVAVYPYQAGDLMMLLKNQMETVGYFASSVFRQFQDIYNYYKKQKADGIYLYRFFTKNYKRYEEMCEKYRVSPRTLPGQEEVGPLTLEDDVEIWLGGFYRGLYELVSNTSEPSRLGAEFYCGMILNISKSIYDILNVGKVMADYRNQLLSMFMEENGTDLFELFTNTYFRVYYLADQEKPDPAFINETVNLLRGYGYGEKEFFLARVEEYQKRLQSADQPAAAQPEAALRREAELRGSLEAILKFVAWSAEEADEVRQAVLAYKQMVNKSATEDADRRRRLVLAKLFYKLYTDALSASLEQPEIPPIVRMFFQFGYLDEELAGLENAAYLYDIVDHLPTDPANGVYTAYEWLMAIYQGKKEPCRNEFDSDYNDHVHELRRNNKINQREEAEMLADTKKKVMFELENVFPVINKVTYGRITTFCPVFSEHNILKPLERMLVTADRVEQIFNSIREKDFGAFCRESIFSQPAKGIPKETIVTEILPDVILTPNIGNRGIMWQEIEGKRRSTPARLMCSVFQMDDLNYILTRLVGEFRWEMCKRIQGARWNDISERSMTSDYYDYLMSYKKNMDLSSEVKEKIKAEIQKAKNNTKEMFVLDYLNWIMYESNGAPRMNKVVRTIFFTYCPFTAAVREKLRINPLYTDVLDKYEIRLKQKVRYLDNVYAKLRSNGHEVPEEIQETRRLLTM